MNMYSVFLQGKKAFLWTKYYKVQCVEDSMDRECSNTEKRKDRLTITMSKDNLRCSQELISFLWEKKMDWLFISQSIELYFYPRAHTNVNDQNTHKLSIRNPVWLITRKIQCDSA